MPAVVMSRFSYPKVPGDGPWSVVDVTGPTSYPFFVGAPGGASGGQEISAADCGLQEIDFAISMGSNDGLYFAEVYPDHFSPGNPMRGVCLAWIVSSTGAQATGGTNLSGSTIRLLVIGR